LKTVHIGHFDIGNQEAALSPAKMFQTLDSGRETGDPDALPSERFLDDAADVRLVIDKEHVMLL
jgi:hypothetical protein